jgi:hypothetical protein
MVLDPDPQQEELILVWPEGKLEVGGCRGAHFPTDVLGSVLFAVPWLLVTIALLRHATRPRPAHHQPISGDAPAGARAAAMTNQTRRNPLPASERTHGTFCVVPAGFVAAKVTQADRPLDDIATPVGNCMLIDVDWLDRHWLNPATVITTDRQPDPGQGGVVR